MKSEKTITQRIREAAERLWKQPTPAPLQPEQPPKPKFAVPVHHPIVFAFESGGRKYFQFQDIMNLCHARAFRAKEVYEEFQLRTTKEVLRLHVDAVDNLLREQKIDIFKIQELNARLKERLDFVISGDTIWKLASVVFFDETENPYDYDYKYGIEKIKMWKKEQDVSAFFFNTPMNKLIPLLDLSESDLRAYIQVAEQITADQLNNLYKFASRNKQNNDLFTISELLNTASH